MKLGIIGLPNVGKSTLFNAITNAGIQSANYPFCTIEPNVGVVAVPDSRLEELTKIHDPDRTVPTSIEFVDIAGLVKGASKGEGLGNKFLSHIREVDAVIHVVRCFESDEIIHVDGTIGPKKDVETINYELILSDIEIVERRLAKAQKAAKADKTAAAEALTVERLLAHLGEGRTALSFQTADEAEDELMADMPLLSAKPTIYAANLSEDDFKRGITSNSYLEELRGIAAGEGSAVIPVCAKIEEEISDMSDEEKLLFLSDLGLEQSGLDRLIRAGYDLLGLISFLTAGKQEVRAWTIKRGTKAPAAAGKIHSDIERGFIRAEIIAYDDLIAIGSMAAAKEKGLIRSEGKEYVMKDGDVTLFRFNV